MLGVFFIRKYVVLLYLEINIMDELDIIIESFDQYDDDDVCVFRCSSLIINGEKVDSTGNHIEAILRYLGYNATVYYN